MSGGQDNSFIIQSAIEYQLLSQVFLSKKVNFPTPDVQFFCLMDFFTAQFIAFLFLYLCSTFETLGRFNSSNLLQEPEWQKSGKSGKFSLHCHWYNFMNSQFFFVLFSSRLSRRLKTPACNQKPSLVTVVTTSRHTVSDFATQCSILVFNVQFFLFRG